MAAQIQIGDKTFAGNIKSIDVTPDENTRTYATDVTVDTADPEVYLGELATVEINIGERTGIWLPLSVILNDGNDYVYVVENDRAKREYINVWKSVMIRCWSKEQKQGIRSSAKA